ncbi:MAG: oxidative damage protection protein [Gammaproteobacteria bacterium]|nr:oxidative damage protection protein [Gammaproteobacteria bacterium]
MSTRQIHCKKLNAQAEALDRAPWPGALGEKIFNEISKPAWAMWLNHQTMLINEYRLNLSDPKSRTFLATEMEKFLWGDGSEKPAGFTEVKE